MTTRAQVRLLARGEKLEDMSKEKLVEYQQEARKQFALWQGRVHAIRQELDDRLVAERFGKGQAALAKQKRTRKGTAIEPQKASGVSLVTK